MCRPQTTSRVSPVYAVGNRVRLQHVDVVSPDGELLIADLCVDVRPGSHLIIEGVNGTGKSSLLRTIGGLWPLVSGLCPITQIHPHTPQGEYQTCTMCPCQCNV